MNIEVSGYISASTEKAILFTKKRKSGKVSFWIPNKHVEIVGEKENSMTGFTQKVISIPDWLYGKTFGK